MKVFNDTGGREWTVSVTVAAVRRVKDLAGVNLLDLSAGGKPEDSLAYRLFADPVLLVDVLWSVIKPQADQHGVTDEQFGEAMAGDCIEEATEALLAELVNFTPNPRDRARLQAVLEKMNGWLERGRDVLQERLNDPKMDAIVEKAIRTLGDSSTSLPQSPDATPTQEP